MTTADEGKLGTLHDALADILLDRIRTRTATPSDLSVARQLLKDNGISCDGPRSPKMGGLMENMPDLPELEQ